jgi:hypothetical protein
MTHQEQARLEEYFWRLEGLIPNPPKNWLGNVKECKWLKIIQERNKDTNAAG